jgi:hypothetical protein
MTSALKPRTNSKMTKTCDKTGRESLRKLKGGFPDWVITRKYSLPTGEGLHLVRKQAYKDLSIR